MIAHPALPRSAAIDNLGALAIGGCDVGELARRFGTPLYVFDEDEITSRLGECKSALGDTGTLHYAAKAYLATWLVRLLIDNGVGLDVCSAEELDIALRGGMAPANIRLHGNNKPKSLLEQAVDANIGAIVVDNNDELHDVIAIARGCGQRTDILLRLNPGIEAHTHKYLQTGVRDSKFGIPIATGAAMAAVRNALEAGDAVRLLGYHAHIGTQILDVEPYIKLIETLFDFAEHARRETAYWPSHVSPGGGVGVTYIDEEPPSLTEWAHTLTQAIAIHGGAITPHISVELGRAIIGNAGVAVYSVGYCKHIPGIRTYLCIDGGMADNIRPALYNATYTILPVERMNDTRDRVVAIAGPYCESGDILIQEAALPAMSPGEFVVVPTAGAYCLPMSSNYNGALRPAVVQVRDGLTTLVQRRQTVNDLLALEMPV